MNMNSNTNRSRCTKITPVIISLSLTYTKSTTAVRKRDLEHGRIWRSIFYQRLLTLSIPPANTRSIQSTAAGGLDSSWRRRAMHAERDVSGRLLPCRRHVIRHSPPSTHPSAHSRHTLVCDDDLAPSSSVKLSPLRGLGACWYDLGDVCPGNELVWYDGEINSQITVKIGVKELLEIPCRSKVELPITANRHWKVTHYY